MIQTQVETFFRYANQEKERRSSAFGFNFETEESRRFTEEIQRLAPLRQALKEQVSSDASSIDFSQSIDSIPDSTSLGKDSLANLLHTSLDHEVVYPSDLSKEQLVCYLLKEDAFQEGRVSEEDQYYLALSMLEIANMLHHTQASMALDSFTARYDLFADRRSNQAEWTNYYLRLCQSFLIAHNECAMQLHDILMERDLYWRLDLAGEILEGSYRHADTFIRAYAKGLTETDLQEGKAYMDATWKALPYVFASLDHFLGENTAGGFFQQFLSADQEQYHPIDLLPIQKNRFGQKRRIPFSASCDLCEKFINPSSRKENWVRTEWILRDGIQEFLFLIYLYTTSYVRETIGGPKKKRSANRYLKKKFARSGDAPKRIRLLKDILKNPAFDQAIQQGVQAYLNSQITSPVKRSKESEKKHLYAMDHGKLDPSPVLSIDKNRLSRAKEDAGMILSLLHEGEIDYH